MQTKKETRHLITSEIVNSIRLLQGISRRQSSEFIRKYRITGPQLGALRLISLSPGISMRRLSEQLYLHTSTVSGIVDRLEKRGYVARLRGEVDRRKVNLHVTSKGKRVINQTPLAGMGLLIFTIDKLPERQLQDILKTFRLLLKIMKIKGGYGKIKNDKINERKQTDAK
jgi:DNA-binding MarR family transcriptional regulator